jgi:hypothetical protein
VPECRQVAAIVAVAVPVVDVPQDPMVDAVVEVAGDTGHARQEWRKPQVLIGQEISDDGQLAQRAHELESEI